MSFNDPHHHVVQSEACLAVWDGLEDEAFGPNKLKVSAFFVSWLVLYRAGQICNILASSPSHTLRINGVLI